MGLDTLIARADGQTIDQTWFNLIRSVLNGDIYPRDSGGVIGDQEGSLGSTSIRWLFAYLMGAYLYNGARSVKIQASSGMTSDYTISLPQALPLTTSKILFVDNTGQASLDLEPDNTTMEISGSIIRVKDGGLDRSKLSALGQQISASSGTASNTGVVSDIANLTVTLTTTGRPVFLCLISDGSGSDSNITSVGSSSFIIQFARDTAGLARHLFTGGATLPVSSFSHIDPVAAGTYVYKVQAITGSSSTLNTNYVKLIAFEL